MMLTSVFCLQCDAGTKDCNRDGVDTEEAQTGVGGDKESEAQGSDQCEMPIIVPALSPSSPHQVERIPATQQSPSEIDPEEGNASLARLAHEVRSPSTGASHRGFPAESTPSPPPCSKNASPALTTVSSAPPSSSNLASPCALFAAAQASSPGASPAPTDPSSAPASSRGTLPALPPASSAAAPTSSAGALSAGPSILSTVPASSRRKASPALHPAPSSAGMTEHGSAGHCAAYIIQESEAGHKNQNQTAEGSTISATREKQLSNLNSLPPSRPLPPPPISRNSSNTSSAPESPVVGRPGRAEEVLGHREDRRATGQFDEGGSIGSAHKILWHKEYGQASGDLVDLEKCEGAEKWPLQREDSRASIAPGNVDLKMVVYEEADPDDSDGDRQVSSALVQCSGGEGVPEGSNGIHEKVEEFVQDEEGKEGREEASQFSVKDL